MQRITRNINDFIGNRLKVSSLIDFLKKKRVPVHKHSIWYYFGGMTLFFFLIQVGTGILLLLYYRPSANEAFESVQFIVTKVHFGWLIRNVHSWSANLMILMLFIHMFSAFLMRAYRKPRELTWITGVLLLFVSLGFGFSGYLLPWNELAFFATKVGTDIAGAVPIIGEWTLQFLRGGEDVTGATLTRFFGFHVAVLPGLMTLILTVHILLVQIHGNAQPPSLESNKKSIPFFPNFAMRDLLGWLVALAILAFLAAIFPWELGQKADPFAPAPAGIKPEWYFMFMFQTLKVMPSRILLFEGEVVAVVLFALAGIFWLLVPFLDKKSGEDKRSPLFTAIGVFGILYVGIVTLLSYTVFE
ncbi:cytochrome bc complex cytochrome b subunit [candidate division KSB1 bacterium]